MPKGFLENMILAEDFKIRCSMVGKIMADSPKGGGLPRGAISFLENWYKEQVTGEQTFKGNKYTKKGWAVEDAAIDDYGYAEGRFGMTKNEVFYSNEYTQGTPDVLIGNDLVVDIKAPWSLDTFYRYARYEPTEKYPCPKTDYFWQLQAYMWVTDRSEAELAYVLMNTPKYLLAFHDVWEDYEGTMDFKERVKTFAFPRSNSHIARIKKRVMECRDYLKETILPKN